MGGVLGSGEGTRNPERRGVNFCLIYHWAAVILRNHYELGGTFKAIIYVFLHIIDFQKIDHNYFPE